MSSITMLSGITRERATSCSSLVTRTSAAPGLCNAASDWEGTCTITIERRRNPPTRLRDEMGLANKANRVRPADRGGDRGTRHISLGRGRSRKSDGFLHLRRFHLRGTLGAQYHHALGMVAVGLGPGARRAISRVY